MAKKKKDKSKNTEQPKEKVKRPWGQRVTIRLQKALLRLQQAAKMVDQARPPDVDNTKLTTAVTNVESVLAQIGAIPSEWVAPKPKGKGKVGIGTHIIVKPDLEERELAFYEQFGGTKLFDNAVITYDDGRNWVVKCKDDIKRLVKKRHVTRAPDPDKKEKS